jgi:hypothetical protein
MFLAIGFESDQPFRMPSTDGDHTQLQACDVQGYACPDAHTNASANSKANATDARSSDPGATATNPATANAGPADASFAYPRATYTSSSHPCAAFSGSADAYTTDPGSADSGTTDARSDPSTYNRAPDAAPDASADTRANAADAQPDSTKIRTLRLFDGSGRGH